MSAMSDMNIEANVVLDLYVEYFNIETNDEVDSEDALWAFVSRAIDLLELLTDRKVADELTVE